MQSVHTLNDHLNVEKMDRDNQLMTESDIMVFKEQEGTPTYHTTIWCDFKLLGSTALVHFKIEYRYHCWRRRPHIPDVLHMRHIHAVNGLLALTVEMPLNEKNLLAYTDHHPEQKW